MGKSCSKHIFPTYSRWRKILFLVERPGGVYPPPRTSLWDTTPTAPTRSSISMLLPFICFFVKKSLMITSIIQRGGVLIQKWGRSSAASTAVSIVDAIRSLVTPTPEGDWFSTGVSYAPCP